MRGIRLSPQTRDYLIEAESFQQLGGWGIDNQAATIMGSPYLLAHGMGIPVQDAETRISVRKAGRYRLWVRMLTVDDINVYYGAIHAIKGISMNVAKGTITTLIGSNGAGKSTTLHTISGLLKPKTGKILFEDQDITGKAAHKIVGMGLSQVPEGRHVFANMTVMENLELGAYLRKDKEGINKDLTDVFTKFPRLLERKDQIAGTLSGGEQQMLAMGRALMSRPKLILLDEPSMGLAPLLVQEIFNIIKEINDSGTTVLLVEQNARMALSIADKAYVLETGKITLEGTGKELLTSEAVQKAYLGG